MDLEAIGITGHSGEHELRRYIASSTPTGLKRPLLLLHGEVDDNVHPSNTLALVDALIRADGDVEFVLIPGGNHACDSHPYYVRRAWDFFVRELLGARPPHGPRSSY